MTEEEEEEEEEEEDKQDLYNWCLCVNKDNLCRVLPFERRLFIGEDMCVEARLLIRMEVVG